MTAVVIMLGIVVGLLAVLVVGLLRSHAEILRALHDLGVNMDEDTPSGRTRTFDAGTRNSRTQSAAVATERSATEDRVGENGLATPAAGPLGDAHDLMGTTISGDGAAIAVTGVGHLSLLAFLSSGCATCLDFWDAFAEPANRTLGGGDTHLVVITRGPDSESIASVADLAEPSLTTIMSSEAFDDYSVPVAPYFVLVDGQRSQIVGEGAAGSFDQLKSLISKALADSGYGVHARRSRRDVIRGRRSAQSADEALSAAGIEPGHPSLTEDPDPQRREQA